MHKALFCFFMQQMVLASRKAEESSQRISNITVMDGRRRIWNLIFISLRSAVIYGSLLKPLANYSGDGESNTATYLPGKDGDGVPGPWIYRALTQYVTMAHGSWFIEKTREATQAT